MGFLRAPQCSRICSNEPKHANAIGDLGNHLVIAVPFLIAIGFAAASLSMAFNKAYGAEIGNLLVAGVLPSS